MIMLTRLTSTLTRASRVCAITAALLVAISISVRAMTPLDDNELAVVFSQAGISIHPDITLNISIAVMAWGDQDGLEPGPCNPWGIDTGPGYMGITGLRMENVRVRLRTDPDDHYGGYDVATMCKPMTIDVGTRAVPGRDQTHIRIGTGALALSSDTASLAVALGPTP